MKSRPKILLIGPCPFDMESVKGGVESVFINLIEGFSSIGKIDIIGFVVSERVKKKEIRHINQDIEIHYYPRIFNSIKFSILYYSIFRIKKIVEKNNIDLVHIQGNGSSLLYTLRLNSATTIITPHGIIRNEFNNSASLLHQINYLVSLLIERVILTRSFNMIYISSYIRNYFLKSKLTEDRLNTIIYNPIKQLFFEKSQDSGDHLGITFIGTLNQRKNITLLLEALLKTKIKFKLDIVGDFIEKNYKKQVDILIQNMQDISINIHGWLNQQDCLKVMLKNKFFILTSKQETLPLVIAEAMACKRLIIASNVGGVSEMIQNEIDGFLFEKNNLEQLINIVSSIENYNLSIITNAANKSAFEKFHPVSVAYQTYLFYNQVLKNESANCM